MDNIKKTIHKRVIDEAEYIIKTEVTIREVANTFGVSKSTVHKDLSERLKIIDNKIYKKIEKIMKKHIEIRHIKGGESTKQKYLKRKKQGHLFD